jgi:Zn-dependent peptidase ImmA (M78 family)
MEGENKMKIPNKFKVGGQDLNVVFKDTIYGDKMGECCIWSGNIQISEIYKGEPQTDSSKFNTFYHELTHAILDTMGEYELSANERFVCTFSGFLSEAIRSFEFNKE